MISQHQIEGAYFDRAIPPELTLDRMLPHFSNLGITRISNQTGLDRLGIPCFASFRPNSKTLSTNQGKGITNAMARASAVMESVEFAVAEKPTVTTNLSSVGNFLLKGHSCSSPDRYLPLNKFLDHTKTIEWCSGKLLWSNRQVWVPLDLVRLNGDAKDLPGVCQTTNGLASGNTKTEAVFHGLCELIERHCNTIWLLRSDESRTRTCFDPALLDDPVIDEMISSIQNAGMAIRMFNQTADIEVPVMMAVIGERTPLNGYFDIAAGYGAHPSPVRAAIRAITEAAQTRITSISAARDDIRLGKHAAAMREQARVILEIAPSANEPTPPTLSESTNTDILLQSLIKAMKEANLADPLIVELAEDLPCSVVRVLSEDLEDFEANLSWRIGKRAEAWVGK